MTLARRPRLALLLLVAGLWAAAPARAALTETDLAGIGLSPPADAHLPLNLTFNTTDGRRLTVAAALAGRPTLLLPLDAACRSVCGPALSLLSGALGQTSLRPGVDYAVLLVGIGGREAASLSGFVDGQIGTPAGVTIVAGPAEAVNRLTDAIGYHWAPDPGNDAVAHPSAFVALTPDGRVSRVLSSLALNPSDLTLALVEAGQGRIGSFADRLKVLCYGFDAVHGIYTAPVLVALRVGGGATVLALIGAFAWFLRRDRALRGRATPGAAA